MTVRDATVDVGGRVRLLRQAGVDVMPVVAGRRITPGGDEAATREGVWRVLNGEVVPPGLASA